MSLTYGMLRGNYAAAQFAEIGLNAFGNGICAHGGEFEVTARGSNGVAINTGFALAGGYWVKNTSTISIYIPYGETAGARYDAIVLRVDLTNRAADVVLEQGVAATDPVKYEPVRDGERYELILAYLYILPATTMISDSTITDTRNDVNLCGMIPQAADLTKSVLPLYDYILSGFPERMAALTAEAQATKNTLLSEIASSRTAEIDTKIGNAGLTEALDGALSDIAAVSYRIGDMLETADQPAPAAYWLLCNGAAVPAQYTALIALIGATLPSISPQDTRLSAWIYGGEP